MSNNKTFVKITNKDIYDKICELKESNVREHKEMIGHQITTNGKVKLNKWIATTSISLYFTLIVTIFGLLIKGVL